MDGLIASLYGDGFFVHNGEDMTLVHVPQFPGNPIWLSWATKLDQSDILYFLPETYDMLTMLTGESPDYLEAVTRNGAMRLYITGMFPGDQPMNYFWDDAFDDKVHSLPYRLQRMATFAKSLQHNLATTNTPSHWCESFIASYSYLTLHRHVVKEVGSMLGVDMVDHDLSKSRIVQIALGYLWHWTGDSHVEELKALAMDAVRAGHLEVEDHHPECATLDVTKLFADRLSVHLQKDPNDGCGGWAIKPVFIPHNLQVSWEHFRDANNYINLYVAFENAKVKFENN